MTTIHIAKPDVKRLQMTSNDLQTNQTNTKSNKENKIILKAGASHENIEINYQYLFEILDKIKK